MNKITGENQPFIIRTADAPETNVSTGQHAEWTCRIRKKLQKEITGRRYSRSFININFK